MIEANTGSYPAIHWNACQPGPPRFACSTILVAQEVCFKGHVRVKIFDNLLKISMSRQLTQIGVRFIEYHHSLMQKTVNRVSNSKCSETNIKSKCVALMRELVFFVIDVKFLICSYRQQKIQSMIFDAVKQQMSYLDDDVFYFRCESLSFLDNMWEVQIDVYLSVSVGMRRQGHRLEAKLKSNPKKSITTACYTQLYSKYEQNPIPHSVSFPAHHNKKM